MHLMRWKGQKLQDVYARKQDVLRSTANVIVWGKNAERNANALIALIFNDKVFYLFLLFYPLVIIN